VLFVAQGSHAGEAVLAHFNADGGRSDFCGNGTRCAARFAVMLGYADSPLVLRTDCGPLRAEVAGESVRIQVPAPSAPEPRTLSSGGNSYEGWFVMAGVPHFVLSVEAPEAVDIGAIGPLLRHHPALGEAGANIDFLGPRDAQGRNRMRTWERGVEGETLACGSGAIAAAAVLAKQGAAPPLTITPTSGIDLRVEFEPTAAGPRGFTLTGEARIVFEGELARGPAGGGRSA
jgi:diaminopimelate epimerase